MIRLIASLSLLSAPQEIEEFLKLAAKPDLKEASAFLNGPKQPETTPERKCKQNRPIEELLPFDRKLLVFMSFSVPLESWKDHSRFLEKIGGHFVLRGLPENSFDVLVQKLISLRKAGVNASIILDPVSFEHHNISAVPTIVLQEEALTDKMIGNISLSFALKKFRDEGETHNFAAQLIDQLEAF